LRLKLKSALSKLYPAVILQSDNFTEEVHKVKMTMGEVDDDYFIPLQDQRVFGAGIKRKRVHFIPAISDTPVVSPELKKPSPAGDRYLSIVMPVASSDHDHPHFKGDTNEAGNSHTLSTTGTPLCQICNVPIPPSSTESIYSVTPHEASIAHQVCLKHSHPPSHLERSRSGLRYLSAYGWDPDSRLGLGASGQGIRIPIKPKVKPNTVGLGADVPQRHSDDSRSVSKARVKLDATKIRKEDAEARQKRDSLQELFYGNEDVEKYLGPGTWTRGFLREATTPSSTANG